MKRLDNLLYLVQSRVTVWSMSIVDPEHQKHTLIRLNADGAPARIFAYHR